MISYGEKTYLTAKETAAFLGISEGLMYKTLKKPGFPACRIGNRWLVSKKGVQEWLEKQMG
jgi:excisionase family DNA binding protein